MPMHIFLLCGGVLLYLIYANRSRLNLNLNLNLNQMSLQFTKRFENKNGFSIFPKLP
jgi:hypothetical protein